MPRPSPTNPTLASAIEHWFARSARDLPWRKPAPPHLAPHRRDPYASLVSELMLQQTQVSRVIDRFDAFLARFPTVHSLAAAPESEVLALWSGLGYYRRARFLHAAARHVVDHHNGDFPTDLPSLLALPGVGRYTAGAIASMAMGQRTPIVDGNVARVLIRLGARRARIADPAAERWAWSRAQELVDAATDPALLNEGLMELGALVCTPQAPRCDACPLSIHCAARAAGSQDRLPLPKAAAPRSELFCAAVLISNRRGHLLIEHRPPTGMWAGLAQAPTLERTDRPVTSADIRRWLTARGTPPPRPLRRVGGFAHTTTHRAVIFDVWHWNGDPPSSPDLLWADPEHLDDLGLSNPQRRILTRSWAPPLPTRP